MLNVTKKILSFKKELVETKVEGIPTPPIVDPIPKINVEKQNPLLSLKLLTKTYLS